MDWILGIFGKKKDLQCATHDVVHSAIYCTMGWDFNPTTTKGDGYILPRAAEMIINEKYYPNKQIGEWPCDPETGAKLPIEPFSKLK